MLDVWNCESARCLVARQKAHGDGIAAGCRQRQTLGTRPIPQQCIRHLDQAAGAIPDQRVGPDRAAMVKIDQDLQSALDDIVRFSSLYIGDETYAARVVLVARIVKTLSARQCHRVCSSPSVVSRIASAPKLIIGMSCRANRGLNLIEPANPTADL